MEKARAAMERHLRHMVRLIDDLLDVSRITRGKLELRLASVELATVVAQAVEISKTTVDCAERHIEINLPSEPVHLQADPARLVQVFGNLLGNACKYTPPGGRITLTAERQDAELRVTVRDTALAFQPTNLPRSLRCSPRSTNPRSGSRRGWALASRWSSNWSKCMAAPSRPIAPAPTREASLSFASQFAKRPSFRSNRPCLGRLPRWCIDGC